MEKQTGRKTKELQIGNVERYNNQFLQELTGLVSGVVIRPGAMQLDRISSFVTRKLDSSSTDSLLL